MVAMAICLLMSRIKIESSAKGDAEGRTTCCSEERNEQVANWEKFRLGVASLCFGMFGSVQQNSFMLVMKKRLLGYCYIDWPLQSGRH
jgi:hypothetical protein